MRSQTTQLDQIQWRENVHARWLYVDPKPNSINFGDHIIDYATQLLLAPHLPAPAGIFDWKSGEYPEGDYDFMIVPGVTMLTAGNRPGLNDIDKLPWPTYCLAGAIWSPLPNRGFLVRSRIIHYHRSNPVGPDLSIVKMMAAPVGARDPFTCRLLEQTGIDYLYTGCPTVTLPRDSVVDNGYILFSLGRGHVRRQKWASHRLGRKYPVVTICHEASEYHKCRAVGWKLPLVNFNGDVELYLSYFKRAHSVITGRLHGALPALAYGKPTFCFGTRDSRSSLLDSLGVPIHDYGELDQAVERASPDFNRYLIDYFLRNWQKIVEQIRVHHLKSD
ncbi:MAG: polysaccharide pyruvyl transferase family protein [Phycisphaerae bacterium]|nr:polysaccharide pyruvyl transferase family protein [Phycisphaerae bacterium]